MKDLLLHQIRLMGEQARELAGVASYNAQVDPSSSLSKDRKDRKDGDKIDPAAEETDKKVNQEAENVLFNLYMHFKFLDDVFVDIETKKDVDSITSLLDIKTPADKQEDVVAKIEKLREEWAKIVS